MKVVIYNKKELFDEFSEIISDLGVSNSIVQNNMVIDYTNAQQIYESLGENIKRLSEWKNKIENLIVSNTVSDTIGNDIDNTLQENYGKLDARSLNKICRKYNIKL